jgi:hypothetical protein
MEIRNAYLQHYKKILFKIDLEVPETGRDRLANLGIQKSRFEIIGT